MRMIFQRFLIAAGSFNASAAVDQCAKKGCSHKYILHICTEQIVIIMVPHQIHHHYNEKVRLLLRFHLIRVHLPSWAQPWT